MATLLQADDFPGIVQKICAYYVMQDLFQNGSHQTETPFTSVLLNASESIVVISKVDLIEKNFVIQLLNSGTKEVNKLVFNRKSIYS